MSAAVKSTNDAVVEDNACPTCNRPLNTPPSGSALNPATPSSKRKDGIFERHESSSSKKTRHARNPPKIRHWEKEENKDVMVHIYDEDNGRKWVPGRVRNTEDIGATVYKIVVVLQDKSTGQWDVVPHTIHHYNQDPIPSDIPSDPSYNLSHYIMGRKEFLEGLSSVDIKHFRCLGYHSGSIKDKDNLPDQDVIDRTLLGDDPKSTTSLRNLIHSLMMNDDVKNVVNIATGSEVCNSRHALAYFVGQLTGIELCEATSDEDPNGLLDQIGSNPNVDCPISQVFLLSVMIARTKRLREVDPTAPLYDSRRKDVLSDPKKLKARISKTRTALAAMHSSMSDHPHITGPSFALLSHGIQLMIDTRGTSDRLLDQLAYEGLTRPAKTLRTWIQKLADAIDPIDARSPPPQGKCHVLAWTADNADFHLFQRCVSIVPVGNILVGIQSEEDDTYFNQHYMKGLGQLSAIDAEHLLPTKAEDKYAQEVIDTQNIVALINAAIDHKWIKDWSASDRSKSRSIPSVNSIVSFKYRSQKHEGTVTESSKKEVKVKFLDGNRLVVRPIPLEDIDAQDYPADSSPQDTVPEPHPQDDTPEAEVDDTFGGERCRCTCSTTNISSILTGMSSKHFETARQVIQEIKNTHGEEKLTSSPRYFVLLILQKICIVTSQKN